MTVAIIPNLTRQNAFDITLNVCKELDLLQIGYLFSDSLQNTFKDVKNAQFLPESELTATCDFVISVGGDGSMIHAAKMAAVKGKRILGINAGHLAYLCGVDADELQMLRCLVTGEYEVEERMLLRADLYENDELVISGICVNDLVVSRGMNNMSLVDIEVRLSGQLIADYIADGVIVSTPTGSTAYTLAAGGPIADPTLDAMLLTPVCPHQLNLRPFIFRPDSVLELSCGKRRETGTLVASYDGEPPVTLNANSVLKITKADIKAEFIKIKPINFVDVLNVKMSLNR
ncbi:MAG: NAD(+)/NADH kinase [Clostridia bacterium]|nr:NAD(+)/NADH kinase [Clostridia bacterium]